MNRRSYAVGMSIAVVALLSLAQAGANAQTRRFRDGLVMAHKDVIIGSKLPRQIASVTVKEGDVVKEGELLIELDNEIEKLQVELARNRKKNDAPLRHAQVALAKARLDLKRLEKLKEDQVVSEIEFDRVKAQADLAAIEVDNQKFSQLEQELTFRLAQARLDQTRVNAPMDGICHKLFKHEGEYVDEREELVRLINIDKVNIDLRVPMTPETLRWLTVGKKARVVCELLAGKGVKPCTGEVTFVASVLDPASNTKLVRLVVDNPEHRLEPGMTVTVEFEVED